MIANSLIETAFDENDPYYDEKSSREKPKWFNVHVGFKHKFDHPERTTLTELRKHSEGALSGMQLFRQTRLSVTKVSPAEWNYILDLAGHLEFKTEIDEPDTSMIDSTVMSVEPRVEPEEQLLHEAEEAQAKEAIREAESTAEFLNEVIEDVADTVAEQVAENMEDINEPASEAMREELAEVVADQIMDQLAEAIQEAAPTGAADQINESTEAVAQVQFEIVESEIIQTTEDLSELPDAPDTSLLLPATDEALDQISSLPSDPIRQSSPAKRVASRRSSRAPSLPRSRRASRGPSVPLTDLTPAMAKGKRSAVPPATVPAKMAARQVHVDAGPESDPAFVEDAIPGAIDDSLLPGDDSMVDDTFADINIDTYGHVAENGSGRVGRTYGGEFEYGDSSTLGP
jgi:EVE domain